MKKILQYIKNILTAFPKYLIIGLQCIFNKEKRKQYNFEKSLIPTTITTLSLITYLITIFILSRWYVQNERIKKFTNGLLEQTEIITNEEKDITNKKTNFKDLIEDNTKNETNYPKDLSYLNINFSYYKKINSETVGWIQVNGTNISYPIVKHSNNSYYLNHDFYNRKSATGWVFADYRNDLNNLSNNTIIYAHNLINRTMFGSLPFLLKENWYNEEMNRYVKISTPEYNSIWQVFSVYKIDPTTDYLKTQFNETYNYTTFLETIKQRSVFDFNVETTFEDKIITLSTCDDTGTKRIVVHAKLYSIEEK